MANRVDQLVELKGDEIKELYTSGTSLRVLASDFQTSPSTIRKVLTRLDVPTRPAGRPKGSTGKKDRTTKPDVNPNKGLHNVEVDLTPKVETEEAQAPVPESSEEKLQKLRERILRGE
jgi:hypothetical protein